MKLLVILVLNIREIKSDKDVENLVVKDGDKELIKGTDYDVDKKQEGNKHTVTITFKGNYKGTITKTYTETPATAETPETPANAGRVQTGDSNSVGLPAAMSLLSIGCIIFLIQRKKKRI